MRIPSTRTYVALTLMVALCGLFAPTLVEATTSKVSFTEAELPDSTEPIPLHGLFLGLEASGSDGSSESSIAKLTAVRLTELPTEGEESLKLEWMITGSNTRPVSQKAFVLLSILSAEGKTIRTGRGLVILKNDGEEREYPVKLKCKAADWEKAAKIRVQIDWQLQ